MSIELIYNNIDDLLVVKITGQLTLETLQAAGQEIMASKEYTPNVKTIWDLREADASNINSQFIQQIIQLRQQHFKERESAKLALVANSDLKFGLSRMYEMLSGNLQHNMHVFRSFEEAEKWLLAD